MRRLPDILSDLRNALDGKSTGETSAALTSIFGVNAASAFGSIINADPARFAALVAQLENSGGAAERTARIMQDNLTGDLEKLGGAVGGLGTSIGTIMLPSVRVATTSISGMVGALDGAMASSGVAQRVFGQLGGGIEGMTNQMINGFEQMLPVAAGMAEAMGILEPGQAEKLSSDFSRRMTEARQQQIEDRAQSEKDQLDNETVSRLNSLGGVEGQISAAEGNTGVDLARDVRARLTRNGLKPEMIPGAEAAIAALEGTTGRRGSETLTPAERRRALRKLNETLAPTIGSMTEETLNNQRTETSRIEGESTSQQALVSLQRVGAAEVSGGVARESVNMTNIGAEAVTQGVANAIPGAQMLIVLKDIALSLRNSPPTGGAGAGTGN
jgi:hypothetical protein